MKKAREKDNLESVLRENSYAGESGKRFDVRESVERANTKDKGFTGGDRENGQWVEAETN